MGMKKLKHVISEIEKGEESTITVNRADYIALLREVNNLRFKCSRRRGPAVGGKRPQGGGNASEG